MARALSQAGLEKLVGLLEGPCAVAAGGEDVVALAKAVTELADKNKSFVIRGGYGEGMVLGAQEVRKFSRIPPRPVLVAQWLCVAQGPVRGMVGAMAGVPRQFVGALDAVAKKKTAEAPVAPAAPVAAAAPEAPAAPAAPAAPEAPAAPAAPAEAPKA